MEKQNSDFVFKSKEIPSSPGCYLFWDKDDKLLYVGKAKDLKKRVSSYFQKTEKSSLRIEYMISKIHRIETRSVHSEIEALVLENNLIKEFLPRFNVRLRDDKNFVYLRITNEDFPKMEITRRLIRDGSYYIGPKTSAKEFRETVRFCQKFFRVRMTKSSLDYYPHVAAGGFDDNQEQYQRNVDMMKQFLGGKIEEVMKNIRGKMEKFALEKNFEAAAKMRDLIKSIQASTQKQTVDLGDTLNRDFIHFVRTDSNAYVVRIAFREGHLLDQNEVVFAAEEISTDEEILEAFLMQFYEKVHTPPREIFIPISLENADKIEVFLSQEIFPEEKITLHVPQKGIKHEVLDIALKNAKHFLERKKLEALSHAQNFAKSLPELAEALSLKEPPRRMECFDISHLGGTSTVASQVVFIDGEPKKSEYRRFTVKSLPDGSVNDFAAMQEILARRFARKNDKQYAEKFPDLIMIDGGKGQLSSVLKAVEQCKKDKCFPRNFNVTKQIISLAKREEQIFRPGTKEPLELSYDSAPLKLLQRIRDEAHRFAVTFNRTVREKKAIKSALDEIPGIGGATRKKLIARFGSVGGIKQASDEELKSILSEKQFQNLKKNL
ncbi:excinuclease ABC subunit UvrC [Candidatus Gracilibacteria bacterium]|nr:excinuclease ABC subunit UvrC [Candidatus Gracilibacteria bacterium]